MPSDLNFSRRLLLAGSTAGAMTPLLGMPAAIAQTLSAKANSGHYSFRIGDIKATVVSDGTLSGNPRIYASTAQADELGRTLSDAFLPIDTFRLNLNTLLLENGDRRILIEAGAAQTLGPDGGHLFRNLAAIGVQPEHVDAIVITHTHPDHVGNLSRSDGSSAFPKAAVYIPEEDFAFFIRNEPDLSRLPMPEDFRRAFIANIKRSVAPVAKSAVLYRPGSELLPGITTIAAGGHTPGMSAILVHSGTQQLLITSDAAYSPLLNIDNAWRPGPDLDPDSALQSRRRLFDRAATERIPVLGFHFPFPGLGNIRKTDGGYRWVTANWRFDG
ncbi:MBL fold metallo-hydrolase [Bradyrhizobium tunisiense]|uniref:MBL fold metallo-hydrolase n=1 Tax=Bradyrhizobium tunisiense TaxID=3278709 RepID=UPI0035E2542F